MQKIFIASDHRGFAKKSELVDILSKKYEIIDLGPSSYDETDDYNDAAISVSKSILKNPDSFGILLCGSSVGITIQANRFKGIRAAACYDKKIAKLSREHNNANILCLSADFLKTKKMLKIISVFLNTKFITKKRYIHRNQRLDEDIK